MRNYSPQAMFERLAAGWRPGCRYEGGDVGAWRAATWPRVLATLGAFPARVPLHPELLAEWEHDGLRKQRWALDVGEHISAACLVNLPGDLRVGERRPAILCWHGHGPFGKEPVMGNDASPALREAIAFHNYSYGHQMAKAGFVTFAIDWMGGGERDDHNKPHYRWHEFGNDWCNVYYMHATMLGMTPLSMNVAHGMAATDFACTLPHVDPERLGVMGLSGGGTMALWSALCDARFSAAEIIGYSDLFAVFGVRDINYCGMQIAPGLFTLVDLPDLQGLLAPRPLLVDIGAYDTCFTVDSALACYRRVAEIYQAAGVPDHLELDLFPGEHGWGGNKSVGFFGRHLGG